MLVTFPCFQWCCTFSHRRGI